MILDIPPGEYTLRAAARGFVSAQQQEFKINDALDARNFFVSNRTPLEQNQFGGAIGGPAVLSPLTPRSASRSDGFMTVGQGLHRKAPVMYQLGPASVP